MSRIHHLFALEVSLVVSRDSVYVFGYHNTFHAQVDGIRAMFATINPIQDIVPTWPPSSGAICL